MFLYLLSGLLMHLATSLSQIGVGVTQVTSTRCHRIFDEVANELVLSLEHFPDYGEIKDEVHVRIRDLPIVDTLRDLRQTHLNQLVRVNGARLPVLFSRNPPTSPK